MDVIGPLLALKLARNKDVLVRSQSAKLIIDRKVDFSLSGSSKKRSKGNYAKYSMLST